MSDQALSEQIEALVHSAEDEAGVAPLNTHEVNAYLRRVGKADLADRLRDLLRQLALASQAARGKRSL